MSQEAIFIAKASGGRLELYENKVVIKNMLQPQIEIYMKDISGVEYSGGILTGFIQIKSKGFTSTGVTQFLFKQQIVRFNSFDKPKIKKAKEILEELIAKYNTPTATIPQKSLTEELEKLSKLKDAGAITEEEFTSAKKMILYSGNQGRNITSRINCPECNKEISNGTKSCPHCGYPLVKSEQEKSTTTQTIQKKPDPKKRKKTGFGTAFLILLILPFFFFLWTSLFPKS